MAVLFNASFSATLAAQKAAYSSGIIVAMPLLSVTAGAELAGFSGAHLRQLLAAGTIDGTKIGPVWAIDKASLRAYLATEHKPGPKAGRCKDHVYHRDPSKRIGRRSSEVDARYSRERCKHRAGPSGYCWLHERRPRRD